MVRGEVLLNRRGQGLPVYMSRHAYMRGHGLGNILAKLFRGVMPFINKPIVKQGLKKVGKSVLRAGVNAASEALEGDKNFGDALKEASKKEARQLLTQVKEHLPAASTGGGTRRRRRARIVNRGTMAVALPVFRSSQNSRQTGGRKRKRSSVAGVHRRSVDIFS